MASSPILTRGDYTVGWICALSTELTAACAMLDQRHEPLDQSRQDENNYILGRIGVHNVVLACLPAGIAGLTSAATIAVQMRSSFKRIRIGLMVGIGGGVPSHDHDIRLGDIVVSKPSGTSGGVIQYDFGKTVQYGRFTRTGSLNRPPDMLLTAISNLQAKHGMKDLELTKYLTDMVIKHPKMASEFRHLGQEKDHLYEGNYAHPGNNTTCSACDISKLVKRKPRHSNVPAIHYGLIASANQLMKDGATRDILRQDLDILCFEMEAAGLMDGFPCIVIRGICDYADSHKNKQWQPWAAAVAAAYAKELLSVISRQQVANKNPVIKVAGQVPSKAVEPVFLVPFERDPQFVGREDIISQIKERLQNKSRACISGIGGVGNSQIAIEYSYRFRAENPSAHVFWVYAANAERFDQAYKDIAEKLNLPLYDDPNADICQLVLEWLNQDSEAGWLMVVDNADDSGLFFSSPETNSSSSNVRKTKRALYDYLPERLDSKRCVLFTTRHRHLGEDLAHGELSIGIETFNIKDATVLLQSKAGGMADNQDGPNSERLLEVLGFIPLAISQAAAFMRRNRMPQQLYLTALLKDERNLTEHLSTELRDPRRESAIPNSIFRTWKLSFDQIQKQEPLAAEILSLSAMLDQQQIPERLLRKDDKREVDFSMAIGTLESLSLITKEIGKETFSMHRLVQLSVQAWLEQHEQIVYFIEETLELLSNRFPGNILLPDYRHYCQSLYPHAHATLKHQIRLKSGLQTRALLLHNLARFDEDEGRYSLGHERLVEAYDIRRELLGEHDYETLSTLVALGDVLRRQGRYQESEERLRLVLKGLTEVSEANEKFTLRIIYKLAETLEAQGKYKEAESQIQKVLKRYENISGTEDIYYLASLDTLARVASNQGNYKTAEEIQQRVVNGKMRMLGAKHRETLNSINSLAIILHDQGNYKAAEEMYRRALKGQEKILGAEHPHTLITVHNLAGVLKDQGSYKVAEKLYRQTLEGQEKILGAEHPHTLFTVQSLAGLLKDQEIYEAAEEMYRRAVSGMEKVLGAEHPDTLISVHKLAGVLKDQGNYKEAEKLYRRAISGREKILGMEHRKTLDSVSRLASLYSLQERYDEASVLYKRVIAGRQKTLGPNHPHTVRSARRYSKMLGQMKQKQYRKAKDS